MVLTDGTGPRIRGPVPPDTQDFALLVIPSVTGALHTLPIPSVLDMIASVTR